MSKNKLKCEDCDNVGEEVICPYQEEMYGKKEKVILCIDCYNARVQDI